MKITAIAPWFGSKRTMAPEIVRQLGPHRAYFGLGCGSLAVELEKPECSQETVCDLHGDITNLARVLQDETSAVALYARLERTIPAEQLFKESQDYCNENEVKEYADPDRAYHFFFQSWLGRNGVAGTVRGSDVQLAVRWTSGGGSPAIRFRSAVESIPWWHARLRNILVLRRCMFKVADSIEDEDRTSIYCDPPYLLGGARDGASCYVHEFAADDHVRLAKVLGRFKKARVVVSYYADSRLAAMYPGWTILDRTRAKNLSVQGRRGAVKRDAPEVLLVNGPEIDNTSLFA